MTSPGGGAADGAQKPAVKRVVRNVECTLPFAERDRSLLDGPWPNRAGLGEEWKAHKDKLTRWLEFVDTGEADADDVKVKAKIREALLRFPNAPIHALHDAPRHPVQLHEEWPNYHTYRVLWNGRLPSTGARHIFLLHNGLNETDDMALHYWLASWILAKRKDAVCIIRPLPGHLSRYRFQGPFSERPLDEYLRNPADVFRQFLRYMVETQWLLSVLVPRGSYEVSTGCDLLLPKKDPGRVCPSALAEEIARQGNEILKASNRLAKKGGSGQYSKEELDKKEVRDSIVALRELVRWSPLPADDHPEPGEIDRPAIHAVGYSMGGFFAQSIFCTWPFAVASCSSLFAGGALRDLAPTGFAHPQEWQSVLHGLRSELDQARIEDYLGEKESDGKGVTKEVLGINRVSFEYINRIFTDVFLQADRGSYSTRLQEFGRRMVFILGGEDPIVQIRNVLDAAPPGGINLHQIGDMSHFPSRKSGTVGDAQRDFWLPELGGMIARFAERTANLLQETHSENWRIKQKGRSGKKKARRRSSRERPLDRALPNLEFEEELDTMLEMVKSGGWLLIARNQIPTVFRSKKSFRVHAAAMHHFEDLIGTYVESLESRAKTLTDLKDRLTLLVPSSQMPKRGKGQDDHAREQWRRDRARFSKSEVGIRYWPTMTAGSSALQKFQKAEAVREVEGGECPPGDLAKIGDSWLEAQGEWGRRDDPSAPEPRISLTMLPDAWIAFDEEACETLQLVGTDARYKREEVESRVVDLACQLAERDTTTTGKLGNFLTTGSVRMVKVSAAEFNPRYRGRVLGGSGRDTRAAASLLVHWAIAFQASDLVLP